jgi:peroxiredoxin
MTAIDWSTLPAPVDDGAAAHLPGAAVPGVALPATTGESVALSTISGLTVLYIYPMTVTPGVALPDGWDSIAGAKGCTPQSYSFRDRHDELRAAGADHLFGLSAQTPEEQAEAATRLRLPYPLLSDAEGAFHRALSLPTFEAGGRLLLRRITLILEEGRVRHALYPVFPPDRNAADVLAWLVSR